MTILPLVIKHDLNRLERIIENHDIADKSIITGEFMANYFMLFYCFTVPDCIHQLLPVKLINVVQRLRECGEL